MMLRLFSLVFVGLLLTFGGSACLNGLRFVRAEGAYCDAESSCAAGFFCDHDQNVCYAQRPLTESCARDEQCTSGFCASGLCCESNCPGTCTSCAVSGQLGLCSPVPAGTDPFDDCPGTTSCSADSSCEASSMWSQRFGLVQGQRAEDVAMGPEGHPVVVGSFENAIALGADTLQSADTLAGDHDAFLVELDGGDGSPRWQVSFQGEGDQRLEAVGVDDGGRVVVAGHFTGSVSIAGQIFEAEGVDLLAAGIDPGGQVAWIFAPTLAGDQRFHDIAVTSDGRAYAVGSFVGAMSLDDCDVATPGPAPAAIVVALDGARCGDAFLAGGSGDGQAGRSIALDASGDVYVAAETRGPVVGLDAMYGGGSDLDVFAFKLAGENLADVRWSRPFRAAGDTGDDHVGGIVVDPAGHTFVVGTFRDRFEAGALAATSLGGSDIFVVRLGAGGAVDVATALGALYDQEALAIALDSRGELAMAGRFEGDFSVGSGAIESAGGLDAFVAKLSADGSPRYSVPVGGIMHDAFLGVAIDESDDIVLAGAFEHYISVGPITLESAGGQDVVVAKLRN